VADRRKIVIRAGLETLYYSGMHHLARQFLAGAGAILTFHRVRPALPGAFQPNRTLEITPEFLEEVIVSLQAAGVELVSMDEVYRRLIAEVPTRRFVAFTFDDGYRDNLQYALPILQRYQVPMTLYLPSAFPEGRGELWWVVLEEAIARYPRIEVTLDGAERVFETATPDGKQHAFETIYAKMRAEKTEEGLRNIARELALGYGINMERLCRELCMGWDEIRRIADDPLVTIGGHTVTHPILAKLGEEEARAEILEGVRQISAELCRTPSHFSYPVGSPDAAATREFRLATGAGFKTAVTTRPGVLFPDHVRHLSALPRISVNGEFQRLRYLDVLLSGAPTALMNRFRRVDAA
jgi:peptidoglycan/xylan/chitin deacetylase (PgdA/CDA1 family)